MRDKLELLRIAIRNEVLPLAERKQAAELLISTALEAVPLPAEDDPEVVERMTAPSAGGTLGELLPIAWGIGNELRGWSRSGATLNQAQAFVREKRRTRLLEELYRDPNLHPLERTEAARQTLERLPALSPMRRNYTPQQLIDAT
ncbi:MAG: hypothetical protein M3O02_03865 [Acidobacteriota bacterium]|nr:hypothetical protein [Acidobacteriota bacterium]